jgi:cell division protease FtsH
MERIAVLLGGRAAEILFLGEPSTGAQDDLAKATDIASDMVRKYGMSALGLRTFERPRMAMVNTDLTAASPREHGDQTAAEIDREVDRLIQEGLRLATSVLEERREVIERLAERLLEEQQLSGRDVREALGLADPPEGGAAAAEVPDEGEGERARPSAESAAEVPVE